MITGKGADGAAAPTSAAAAKPDNGRADSAPVPYETFKDKNTKLKAKEKELLAEKATADWLCDSCGVQNFATLATGATRTKCFKCQTPRGDDVAIVAGTGKASTGQVEKVVVKAPPGAVLDLQNKKKFSSQAESEKVDQEDRLHRKRKNQYFDAWRRSNRPSAILLPPLLRKVLEGLFGLSVAGESGEGAIVALDLDTVLCDVGQRGVVTVAQAEGGGCPGLLSLLPPSAQMEVARELAALLVKEGFSSGAVAAAIDSVARSPGEPSQGHVCVHPLTVAISVVLRLQTFFWTTCALTQQHQGRQPEPPSDLEPRFGRLAHSPPLLLLPPSPNLHRRCWSTCVCTPTNRASPLPSTRAVVRRVGPCSWRLRAGVALPRRD